METKTIPIAIGTTTTTTVTTVTDERRIRTTTTNQTTVIEKCGDTTTKTITMTKTIVTERKNFIVPETPVLSHCQIESRTPSGSNFSPQSYEPEQKASAGTEVVENTDPTGWTVIKGVPLQIVNSSSRNFSNPSADRQICETPTSSNLPTDQVGFFPISMTQIEINTISSF